MKSISSLIDMLAMFGCFGGFGYAAYLQLVKSSQTYDQLIATGHSPEEATAFVEAYATHQSIALYVGVISLVVAIVSAMVFREPKSQRR